MRLVVTTSRRPTPEQEEKALCWARRLEAPYVPRRGPLSLVRERSGAEAVLVIGQGAPVIVGEGGELFFHPGTALLRLHRWLRGQREALLQATALAPGDRVLDATLGLGAEALLLSFGAGPSGRVVGVERSAVIAWLVRDGLRELAASDSLLAGAAARIEVVIADHLDYLSQLPDDSFEVVYFDPFFRRPVAASVGMVPLRLFGVSEPLRPEAVAQALRVARRRVVLKERRGSSEFARLGFQEIMGGKHSRVAYGVIRKR
ncbi:class I SAM-dependent methyltransferase [Desulfothermobacter acidiphilus]|uniref:class I SAM-dependent methyltransferase n=1 Tax=Desulfothermobacter acidiphilus TaxID=1938353 RepID=UPI003F89274F